MHKTFPVWAAALAVLAALAVPTAWAVDIGCHSAATVIAGPMSQATGWAPACTVIADGGTIEWVIADPVSHSVLMFGCYDSDTLLPGESASASFAWDAQNAKLLVTTEPGTPPHACDPVDVDGAPAVRLMEDGVEVSYICGVHPLTMPGKIQIMSGGAGGS